jgi:putative ABC transport system permease protein
MSEPGALPLSHLDLAVASGLVVVAGLVSIALRLGLVRSLLVAALRTVVQLALIGYLLQWVFDLQSAPLVLGWLGIMVFAASRAAVGRSSRKYPGVHITTLITLTVVGLLTTFTVTGAIVHVDPWFDPQYVIPLCGMVLGNSLTGLSLCLDSLLESFDKGRAEVELRLALGATAWEASLPAMRAGVRRGMVPILNSMTVVGIVSLPGMMTGQILAGADPLVAVKDQVVVMFMLAASTSFGSIMIAVMTQRRLFTPRHQLRSGFISSESIK